MMKAVILSGLTGCWFFLITTGCTSSGPSIPIDTDTQSAHQSTDPSPEALAEYSMAVRGGIEGDAETVIQHYRAAVAQDPGNNSIKMELALILLHQGDYNGTISLVDEIIQSDKGLLKAWQLKALALRISGRKEESLAALKEAAKIIPANSGPHLEVAAMYIHLKDPPGAVAYLELIESQVDDPAKIYEALGELYVAMARTAMAGGQEPSPDHLTKISAACGKYPDNALILMYLGELLVLHGRINDALSSFDRAAELTPATAPMRRTIGTSLASINDRSKAIEFVKVATAERPGEQRLWILLAELYELEKMPQEAIQALKSAVATDGASIESYLRLAYLYMKQEQSSPAMSVIDNALGRFPDDHRIYELKAYLLLREQDFTNATAVFAMAENMIAEQGGKPFLKNFHLNAALANQLSGHIEKAADLIREGFPADPEIIEQFMTLAFRSREEIARVNTALEVLDKVSDLLPRESGTYAMFGLLAMRTENYPAALSMFEQAREMAIEAGEQEEALDAQFYFWLGSAAERNRLFDKAEEYFLEAIRLQPDHADAHNYLAYMLAERGTKLEMALDHAAVALAVNPENAAYLDTRGWIYYQKGDYTNALVDIRLASEKMPDDPTISEHLGDVHEKLGMSSEAALNWQKALELDPGNTNIAVKLRAISAADEQRPDDGEDLLPLPYDGPAVTPE